MQENLVPHVYTLEEMDTRIARARHLLRVMHRLSDGPYAHALRSFDEYIIHKNSSETSSLPKQDVPIVLSAGILELFQEIIVGEKFQIENIKHLI